MSKNASDVVLLRPGKNVSSSSSEDIVELPRHAALMSELIQDMLEDDASPRPEIPLPNVEKHVLQWVCDFCRQHSHGGDNPMSKIPRPLPSSQLADVVSAWDVDYITQHSSTVKDLFDLILAANYLHIPDLLDLGCAKLTTMIKDKSPDEIKSLFALPEHVTAYAVDELAEEERIRKENPWIFDLN